MAHTKQQTRVPQESCVFEEQSCIMIVSVPSHQANLTVHHPFVSPADALAFSGPAPEIVNGRLVGACTFEQLGLKRCFCV